ncbi:MAG: beta-ketoacyl-ACP synthase II [Planctomycetes bacterium]|nr:beta-ketoacyl-ACP synthase II [Planctomycetota bacterium]
MSRRRVVITGVGAVSSLGLDLPTTWSNLLAGKSGAGAITRFDTAKHTCKFACDVWDWQTERFFEKKESKKLEKFTMYYLVAADEAWKAAGLDMDKEDRTLAGCITGTGIGGIDEIEASKVTQLERGADRVSPFFIPKIMANAMAGQAAIRFGLMGTCYVTSSACASSSHAIGMAYRTIQWGEADIMLTGGSEAATTELGLGGFCALKAVSTRNDAPQKASRPFDKDRDGFVMGEGAAALVLEEYEHAKKRGANILCELKGYGSTDDAFHITAPNEDADGPTRAMRQALKDGGLSPELVQYVNAHGTSTYLNDKIETAAIKRVFGDHAYKLAVSSTKSMVGHLLGASGAMELVVCAQSIGTGMVHPTINYETPDPDCDLDYVPNVARELRVDHAISNSLGFGGHNTSLLLGRV